MNLVDAPREEMIRCRGVIRIAANHRPHETQVVRTITKIWKQVADEQPALTAGLKLPRSRQQPAGDSLGAQVGTGGTLSREFLEARLRIEQVDVRRPPGHEEEDDMLGLRRVRRHDAGRCLIRMKQISQCERSETRAQRAKHLSA